jgi:hypothetical protein
MNSILLFIAGGVAGIVVFYVVLLVAFMRTMR